MLSHDFFQLVVVDWLAYELIHSGLARLVLVNLLGECCQTNNIRLLHFKPFVGFTYFDGGGRPIHVGHAIVEQD